MALHIMQKVSNKSRICHPRSMDLKFYIWLTKKLREKLTYIYLAVFQQKNTLFLQCQHQNFCRYFQDHLIFNCVLNQSMYLRSVSFTQHLNICLHDNKKKEKSYYLQTQSEEIFLKMNIKIIVTFFYFLFLTISILIFIYILILNNAIYFFERRRCKYKQL